MIGEGKTPAEAVKEVGMVVEGINALPAAVQLAETYKVDMPIVMTVNKIVNEGLNPKDAVNALLQRDLKSEIPAANAIIFFNAPQISIPFTSLFV